MLINHNLGTRRFSLYQLDEGEMYIKEFVSNCQFIYPTSNQIENLQGVIHFCSRSIIFEPDSENYSIVKFHFRNFTNRPKIQNISNKEMFKFTINKILIIPTPPIIDQYHQYNITTDVILDFLFEKIEIVAEIIYELIDKYNSKQSLFEFDSIEYLGTLYSFQFDYTQIKTVNEKFLLKCELIVKQHVPLIDIPGMLMMTDMRIYFQPIFKINWKKCITIRYSKIIQFFKRQTCQGDLGLEICTKDNKKNLFITFDTESNRDMIYELVNNQTSLEVQTNISIEKYTKLWVEGALSNYEYLLLLNSAGNRTRNDLSRYPIFPWIVNNYTSNTLDLSNKNNFRDLSKPIGALNTKRLQQFKERYYQMNEPKFLYGTHYSTPAYVIGYLVRKYPEYMLKLHSGKFDHPDRLFSSIEIDWKICNTLSVKELIPEFYEMDTSFLTNEKNINFGLTTEGEKIDNVKLPPWALNQNDFLKKMRDALESDYVNENLHKWIDLIFGYKSRGNEAISSDNLFHPLCYDNGRKYIEKNENSENVKILKIQINEFGQVPKQLFRKPHPQKYSNKIATLSLNLPNINSKDQLVPNDNTSKKNINDGIKNADLVNLKNSNNAKNDNDIKKQDSSIIDSITNSNSNSNEEEKKEKEKFINCYSGIVKTVNYSLNKKYIQLQDYHKSKILSSCFLSEVFSFVTGSEDAYIKIYDYSSKKISKEYFMNSPVTSLVSLNENSLVAMSLGESVNIMNCQIGKLMSNFFIGVSNTLNIFHSKIKNILITDCNEGIVNAWELTKNSKIPCETHYLFSDEKIISSDFNGDTFLYFALSSKGECFLQNIKCYSENIFQFHIENFDKYKPIIIKSDLSNFNQFVVGFEKGIKIFDIRNMKCIKDYKDGNSMSNIFNDSNEFLFIEKDKLELFNYQNDNKMKFVQQWSQNQDISHSNIKIFNKDEKMGSLILLGMDNGGICYSDINIKKDYYI